MTEEKTMAEVYKELAAPFPVESIKWRVGAVSGERGLALAYIDARDVMNRLDEVCGQGNWKSSFVFGDAGRVCATIAIKIQFDDSTEWVSKSDVAGATDVEGEKGAASDAFKRAGVHWGIARYLYQLDSPWVAVQKRGKTTIISPGQEEIFAKVLAGEPPPARKARESGEQEGSNEAPPDRGVAKRISDADKKHLYATNFKAWQSVGKTDDQVKAMKNDVKFAPVNFAVASCGCRRIEDLYVDQLEEAKDHMRNWVKRYRDEGEPPAAPDPTGTF